MSNSSKVNRRAVLFFNYVFIYPLIAICGTGLAASSFTHVAAIAGKRLPPGLWVLHTPLFILWPLAVLTFWRLTREFKRKDAWNAALRGCSRWTKWVLWVFVAYAIVNFFFVFLFPTSQGAAELVTLRAYSGYWMAFYAAAMALFYSAANASAVDNRRCRGHDLPSLAKFCPDCGWSAGAHESGMATTQPVAIPKPQDTSAAIPTTPGPRVERFAGRRWVAAFAFVLAALAALWQLGHPTAASTQAPIGVVPSLKEVIVSERGDGQYRTINEAIAHALPGARIKVLPGKYNEMIVIDRPLEIVGQPGGPGKEVIVENTEASCIVMHANQARVSQLTLRTLASLARKAERSRAGPWLHSIPGNDWIIKLPEESAAVEIPQGELVLEGCDIYSELLAGVMVWGPASNPTLRRCTIHDGYWNGVRVSQQANATLEDCEIFGTVWNGIRVDTGAKSLVRRCKIHDGRMGGILFASQSSGVVEDSDIFANAFQNIEIREGSSPVIRRCQVHDSRSGGGIYVHGDGGSIIEDCDVFRNHQAALEAKEGADPIIRRCKIHDGLSSGFLFWKKALGKVEDCKIFNNAREGAKVIEESKTTIRGSEFSGQGNSDIEVSTRGFATIENCTLHDSKGSGLYFFQYGMGTVENCDIYRHKSPELVVTVGANPTVRRCKMHDGSEGILSYNNGIGTFEQCEIFGNRSGIEVTLTSNPLVRQCRIYNHEQSGVLVQKNGTGRFSACEIVESGYMGVEIREGGHPVLHRCRINRNGMQGIMVHLNASVTIDQCDLASNVNGPLNVEPGSQVFRPEKQSEQKERVRTVL